MRRGAGSGMDPGVFRVSLVISLLFVLRDVFFNLAAVARTSDLDHESGG
jgi:hypothetical protein